MTEFRFVFRESSLNEVLECLRYSSGSVDRFEVQEADPRRLIVYVLPPPRVNRDKWFELNQERAKSFRVDFERVRGI